MCCSRILFLPWVFAPACAASPYMAGRQAMPVCQCTSFKHVKSIILVQETPTNWNSIQLILNALSVTIRLYSVGGKRILNGELRLHGFLPDFTNAHAGSNTRQNLPKHRRVPCRERESQLFKISGSVLQNDNPKPRPVTINQLYHHGICPGCLLLLFDS